MSKPPPPKPKLPKEPGYEERKKIKVKSENGGSIVRSRPAETLPPAALGVSYLISLALGLDDNAQAGFAIATIIAALPGVVTFIVELRRD